MEDRMDELADMIFTLEESLEDPLLKHKVVEIYFKLRMLGVLPLVQGAFNDEAFKAIGVHPTDLEYFRLAREANKRDKKSVPGEPGSGTQKGR
jgi:hypothetical protein